MFKKLTSFTLCLLGSMLVATLVGLFFTKNSKKSSLPMNQEIKQISLSENIILSDYKLSQKTFCKDSRGCYGSYGYEYTRFVMGDIINNGPTIPAGSMHILFNIYQYGKEVSGAYCLVWNESEIKNGEVWSFGIEDNMDDCFSGVKGVTRKQSIETKEYEIRYKNYDIDN